MITITSLLLKNCRLIYKGSNVVRHIYIENGKISVITKELRNRICEHDTMSKIFEEKIEQYLLASVLGRVKDYVSMVDKQF